ncbi:hypothetical protein [Mycolicibacterium llatzerense]|uniref:hypothetical protein n=1 Tax=Mycolicibacterium llatzerense TaxID=280871 RepID=UPI0021B656E7|nr:hypothetical protein [Mycolicibacterium llatzerense]MCT7361205.1 hypothetical protein [Mycolicibacterium llatzerense]
MARDHARIHLDIWGDDDWMDLPVDAQMLYFTLYTSEGRTLCGSHEWSPKRLAQRAGDWTVGRIEAAAEVLSRDLFLIIDADTDECLLRSWIKHDGLWRTPNMAVSVANARGSLASKVLRGVIVYEVQKLRSADPKSTSWQKPAVQSMLNQKAIDPAELEPFKGASNSGSKGGRNGASNPWPNGGSNGAVNENPTHGVNGAANGGPTNAIPIANATSPNGDEDFAADDEPAHIDNPAKPAKRRPSSGAQTVVRQVLGNSYPRTTVDRLAVQVEILTREEHPDALIRQALTEWDQRADCTRPEFLPTVLGDLVKRSRARPDAGGLNAGESKVAGWAALGQPQNTPNLKVINE